MRSGKTKEFRDAVHGYVSVPAEWCGAFVDTPIFQRLKYIEQTSMRPLYPCARHDRFAHSLGVFHLARTAFQRLKENTDRAVLDGVDLDKYEAPFAAAALMHDCAHAPFSHTFEPHYMRRNKARDFLLRQVDDGFKKDYEDRETRGKEPAPHEIFSAGVFLKHFRGTFESLCPGTDPQLVARMITGCVHGLAASAQDQVEDCLIQLINGPAIDVDKLDYIMRDTWSSGVNNVSIDVQRLLSGLEIVFGARRRLLAFRKSALSVLKSVLDGRNYLYRWIYSHHTVKYYSEVLQTAVDRLDDVLSPPEKPGAFLDAVFSEEAFEKAVAVGCYQVYLPSDYDILAVLKQERQRIPEVDELLARKPSRIPLWKTHAEFEEIFANASEDQRAVISGKAGELLAPILATVPDGGSPLVVKVRPSLTQIENRELFVKLFDKPVALEEIARTWEGRIGERQNLSFFYVFIPRTAEKHSGDCISALRKAPV